MLLLPSAELPENEGNWAFELKYDGMRAMIHAASGRMAIQSRRGRDFTLAFPELLGIADSAGGCPVLLDGEIVCAGPDGRPSFERIRRRWAPWAHSNEIRRRALDEPATFVVFDVLSLDGRDLTNEPWHRRRAVLDSLELRAAGLVVAQARQGIGPELLTAVRRLGLEGIVAKRMDSRYEAGRRSGAWLKIKNLVRERLVVGAWLPSPSGHGVQALLVGRRTVRGLAYLGAVKYGLAASTRGSLLGVLNALRTQRPAFEPDHLPGNACSVHPVLEVEVQYLAGSEAGPLRHASLRRL